MKIKTASKFTQSLVNDPDFINRKAHSLFSVLCDTKTGLIYPVPANMEHVDWSAIILSTSSEGIQNNPDIASHIIPVIFQLDAFQEHVESVLTGTSGLELGYGVRHTKDQLEIGNTMALEFIAKGDFPLSENPKIIIIRKWQRNL